MAKPNVNRTRQAWTDAQRREHLRGLAKLDGDIAGYCQLLKAQGESIAERTLRHWRDSSHVEEYEQIRRELLGQDTEAIVRDHKRIEFLSSAAQEQLAHRVLRVLGDEEAASKLPFKVMVETMHKLGVVSQQRLEGIARARGEPTAVVKHVSMSDVLREIQSVVDSDAEEIPPAELTDGTSS